VGQVLRLATREHSDGGRAHAVDVRRGPRAPLELLRRHVSERTHDGATAGGAELVAHRAEVDERERAVGTTQHVAGLDVAMHDRRRHAVEVREHDGAVLEQAHDLVGCEALTSREQLGEALAVDALHHEVERPVLLEVLDVAGHHRVPQRRDDARLPLCELHVLPGLRLRHVEALDRDGAVVAMVVRVERLALRADAE
jgi:hypothetical protein